MNINQVIVFGSGNMGKQLALLFLNSGLNVKLVKMTEDRDSEKFNQSQKDISKYFNKRLFNSNFLNNFDFITYKELSEDSSILKESDMVIEAIKEDINLKKDLFKGIENSLGVNTVLATNTSSLSIEELARKLPIEIQQRFIGLHFFTPVRQMKLVEMIPSERTDAGVVEDLQYFISYKLGKNYILGQDVIGFVANRIGFYANHEIMYRAEQSGLTVSQTDEISGKLIGRNKMGPYRLTDFTGIDLSYESAKGYEVDNNESDYFFHRQVPEGLIDKGWFGDKSGQGYYKQVDGETYEINFRTLEYQPIKSPGFKILDELKKNDLKHNLEVIFESDDSIAIFMWESLRNVMYYAAINVGYATDNFEDIDRAMTEGYNWQLGPFQLWDLIGFEKVKDRIETEIGNLPEWIQNKTDHFYQNKVSSSQVSTWHSEIEETLWKKKALSELYTTKDNILLYFIATPNNALNIDLLNDLHSTVQMLEESDYIGLVISTPSKNFSVGFDINKFIESFERDTVNEDLDQSLHAGHELVSALKYAQKPIISGIKGHTLGGGAEIAMHTYETVAYEESKMGLVEASNGLVPGGGGLVELAERVYTSNLSRYEKKRKMMDIFNLIVYSRVSNNAHQAVDLGYLKENTIIVKHGDLVIDLAFDRVRTLSKAGFVPQQKATYKVLGSDFIATAMGLVNNWYAGNFITDYQRVICKNIATVLAGGDLPMGTTLNRDQLVKEEKKAFKLLSNNEETNQLLKQKMGLN